MRKITKTKFLRMTEGTEPFFFKEISRVNLSNYVNGYCFCEFIPREKYSFERSKVHFLIEIKPDGSTVIYNENHTSGMNSVPTLKSLKYSTLFLFESKEEFDRAVLLEIL